MHLLLDTHAVLWALTDDPRLSSKARELIVDGSTPVFMSAASAWEIAIKRGLGRLRSPDDLTHQLAHARIEPLSITVSHALAVEALPDLHRDPFDRLIVAQAISEDLTVVSRDPQIHRYGVPVLWA